MKRTTKNTIEGDYQSTRFFADPKSIASEQFRMMRTNIEFMSMGKKIQTLSVSSPAVGVGKTTISANLAVAFASQKKKVLLVDTDLRKPKVHLYFEIPNNQGLSSLFVNFDLNIEDVIHQTIVENLFVLPCGLLPPNPAEMLSSERMNQIMQQLNAKFDLIIYDTPPITIVADAQIMAGKVDGTIFVLQKGRDKKASIRKAKELADAAQANVLGVVFNREENSGKQFYYYNEIPV